MTFRIDRSAVGRPIRYVYNVYLRAARRGVSMLERNPTAVSTMETSAIRVVKQHPYDKTNCRWHSLLLDLRPVKIAAKVRLYSTIKIFLI